MAVMTIFFDILYLGLIQTSGRAIGPTHKNAMTKTYVLKYHFDGSRFIIFFYPVC